MLGLKMNLKNNFTLSWFHNHRNHRLERFEQPVPTHLAYALNKRVLIGVKCFSCNVITEYDFVSMDKFYENV